MDNNRISALKRRVEENEIRPQEAREALEHHLRQLQRLGATLEDSVWNTPEGNSPVGGYGRT